MRLKFNSLLVNKKIGRIATGDTAEDLVRGTVLQMRERVTTGTMLESILSSDFENFITVDVMKVLGGAAGYGTSQPIVRNQTSTLHTINAVLDEKKYKVTADMKRLWVSVTTALLMKMGLCTGAISSFYEINNLICTPQDLAWDLARLKFPDTSFPAVQDAKTMFAPSRHQLRVNYVLTARSDLVRWFQAINLGTWAWRCLGGAYEAMLSGRASELANLDPTVHDYMGVANLEIWRQNGLNGTPGDIPDKAKPFLTRAFEGDIAVLARDDLRAYYNRYVRLDTLGFPASVYFARNVTDLPVVSTWLGDDGKQARWLPNEISSDALLRTVTAVLSFAKQLPEIVCSQPVPMTNRRDFDTGVIGISKVEQQALALLSASWDSITDEYLIAPAIPHVVSVSVPGYGNAVLRQVDEMCSLESPLAVMAMSGDSGWGTKSYPYADDLIIRLQQGEMISLPGLDIGSQRLPVSITIPHMLDSYLTEGLKHSGEVLELPTDEGLIANSFLLISRYMPDVLDEMYQLLESMPLDPYVAPAVREMARTLLLDKHVLFLVKRAYMADQPYQVAWFLEDHPQCYYDAAINILSCVIGASPIGTCLETPRWHDPETKNLTQATNLKPLLELFKRFDVFTYVQLDLMVALRKALGRAGNSSKITLSTGLADGR